MSAEHSQNDMGLATPIPDLMAAVTRLGDPAVTIAVASTLFAVLLVADRAVAFRWAAAVLACGLVTISGKIALLAWGDPSDILLSPSGHAAAAVLVYGALASLDARRMAVPVTALVVLVAISRVYLHQHTVPDVVAGFLIGLACLVRFVPGRPIVSGLELRAGSLACWAVGLTGAALGWHLHLDPWLRAAAVRLSG